MKKLKGLLAIAAISCLLFASCKQDPDPEDNPEKGNTTEESSETKNDNPPNPEENDQTPKEEDDKDKDNKETSTEDDSKQEETSEEKNPEKETTEDETSDKEEAPEEVETGKSAFIITYSTSDISIKKSEANGKITLTANSGFTDYEWKLDGTTVSSKNVLEITGKTAGTYVYELTAKKNNELYSACVYVVIK